MRFEFFTNSNSKIPTYTVEIQAGRVTSIEVNDVETAEKETINREETTERDMEKIKRYFKEMLLCAPYTFREMHSKLYDDQELHYYGSKIMSEKKEKLQTCMQSTENPTRRRQFEKEMEKYDPYPIRATN